MHHAFALEQNQTPSSPEHPHVNHGHGTCPRQNIHPHGDVRVHPSGLEDVLKEILGPPE